MSIPKKIHYVWVGGKEKPELIKRCMKTWENHLNDYEIIEWNEQNFDINSHPFAKKAYDAKKWAYVSDYIRSYVIYNEGGIYLDTDILVLDNFDGFLDNQAFVGYENPDFPFTAVFGAVKKHSLVKEMLDYYDKLADYSFDFKSNNTISVSDILIKKYDCKKGNIEQILKDDIKVYPDYILCNPSDKSVTIHIFTGTWLDGMKPTMKKVITWLKVRTNTRFKAKLYNKFIRRGKS